MKKLDMGLALLAVTAALVEPAGGQVQYTHPSWSPRGDLIAFDSDLSGEYHIWVVRPDGSGLRTCDSGRRESLPPFVGAKWRVTRV